MTGRDHLLSRAPPPPERVSPEVLQQQIALSSSNPVINGIMKCAGGLLAVLSEQRQVLCLNDALLRDLGIENGETLLGLRIGEVLKCTHAEESAGGCGTTRYCASCGAAIAMAACMEKGAPSDRKCILTIEEQGKRQERVLHVHAAPIEVGSTRCLLLFMQDVTANERNAFLEQMFLHDLNNLVSGLGGVTEALAAQLGDDQQQLGQLILRLTRRLCREMEVQRAVYRERTTGTRPLPEPIRLADLALELRDALSRHPACYGKELSLGSLAPDAFLKSDPSLLHRVLLNMLINAFEATESGGMVRFWMDVEPDRVLFHVWNRAVIPVHIRPRLFQLYFSTKPGNGRGIGTFMIKMIAEDFLSGSIEFETSRSRGTTFHLEIPRRQQPTSH